MIRDFNQPRSDDSVLGGQAPPTSAVLGGLAAVRQHLTHPPLERQIAALSEALNYGQSGLELAIQVLLEPGLINADRLQPIAYDLLRDRPEPIVRAALRTYNPYPYFQCLATYIHEGFPCVWSVVLSPDGQTVLSRDNLTVKAWNVKTGRVMASVELPFKIEDDVSQAIANFYPHLRLWSMRNGEIEHYLFHKDRQLAFFPDGETVASCGKDKTIRLWNRHTGTLLDQWTGHLSLVYAIAISPDGQTLVSGGYDRVIAVWDVSTKQVVKRFTAHVDSIWALAISPDGQTVVSASADKTIRVWDLHTEQEIYTLQGHQQSVGTIAMSLDGTILVSGSGDKTVKVWNLQTGQNLQTLTGHTDGVLSVAISQDKQQIVSGGEDSRIKIWGMPMT